MKKTLVALAALAATGAFAQVTMYGSIDVAYGVKTHTNLDGTQQSKVTGVMEGLNAGNRIGFRGTEDLGGGLKANFVIENGLNITNGNLFSTRAAAAGQQIDGYGTASGNMPSGAYSTSTNRQSYVALESATLGQVRLGYQYTNFYQLGTLSGYMNGSEQPGSDVAHLLSNADFGGTRANAITYISPRFSGVQATFQHGAGAGRELLESTAAANAANGATDVAQVRNSLMLNYNGVKNFDVAYAYTAYGARTSATTALVSGNLNNFSVPSTTAAGIAASDNSSKLHQLGASYTFPMVKLSATYYNGTRDQAVNGSSDKYLAQQIGIEGLFGAFRPYAQFGSATVRNTNAAGTENTYGDYRTQQFGVRYDLSKRTTAYFMMGTSKDDATVTATGAAAAAGALVKREVTALGIYHSF